MSKTTNTIKLLIVLDKNRDKYMNLNELGEALGTNPRNVREYKKELESAGFILEVERGRNGGVKLLTDLNAWNEEKKKEV